MLYAEKQLGKQYSATFDWSPKLKEAVQAQRYWYLKLKQVKALPVSPIPGWTFIAQRGISRKIKKCHYHTSFTISG
jgi:hypothetical protein